MAVLETTQELLNASQYLCSLLHVVYLCHHIHVAWVLQPDMFQSELPVQASCIAGAQQLLTSLLVLYISGNISWQ